MRIVFVSNFYPPASRGGYEQWCQEVLDRLRDAGQDAIVLTSDYRKDQLSGPGPAWVHRDLQLEMELVSFRNAIQFFTHRKKREQENLDSIREWIERFQPDVALIWGMWNLHRSLPALVEELMPGRVAYYMGDYWPTLPNQFENYWNAPARSVLTGLPKLALRPFAQRILAREQRPVLKFKHVLFPTAFMQNEFARLGVASASSKVVYGAIDTSVYNVRAPLPARKNQDVALLCIAARLEQEKGVHTAIEAVGYLVRKLGLRNLRLTIVGGHGQLEYDAYLRILVREHGIESLVEFRPPVPKEELPALYQQADIFLFTSIWPEPFGRVIVEAMASGVVVVGTAVGGAAEILVENETALIYPPDDAVGLAQQLRKLIESPDLRARFSKAGREIAIQKFDMQRMTAEIEACLESLIKS
jgi:glycosyltransferase involved in cell wall biosynthesis